jgi:hypothetical protein
MWFDEPRPSPERSSPTRLSTSGQPSLKGWSCKIGKHIGIAVREPYGIYMPKRHLIIRT